MRFELIMRRLTYKEWEEEGTKLFGEDKLFWTFKCPLCESRIQTIDWQKVGAPVEAVGFSCIGRYIPKEKSQRALGYNMKVKKGIPCDYTLGGLFKFHTQTVIDLHGNEYPIFSFALEEQLNAIR